MNRYLVLLVILFICVSCTDHGKVMEAYKNGNPNANDLLIHGFNMRNSAAISSYLIDRALEGDEEAKQIIYIQIESLRGLPSNHSHVVPVPIPIHTSSRR